MMLASLATFTVPQGRRREHRQEHGRMEGTPRDRPAYHSKPTSRRLCRSISVVARHPRSERAPPRPQKGEEHQALRQH